MVIPILSSFSRFLVSHPTDLQRNLRSTIKLIGCCGLIFWSVYLSEFRLDLLIEDSALGKLDPLKILNDISFTLTPFLVLRRLQIQNDPDWATEMSTFSRAFFVAVGGFG